MKPSGGGDEGLKGESGGSRFACPVFEVVQSRRSRDVAVKFSGVKTLRSRLDRGW